MDTSSHFRGKKITLMRIGLLGRGVQDAAYLAKCGADVLVVDDAPQEVMQPSVDALKEFKNIQFKFGKYDLEDFRNCDLVLKGAGAALNSPEIAEAHKHNIPVRMSADLFTELAGIQVIGVTGTRGKSTVTHMVHTILKKAGKQVVLGGNVRGISTLALLEEATPEHIAVLELDSWQLQGFGEARLSPHIAIFTTLYPDHQNYYKEHLEQYLADKANIFLYQKPSDTLVLGKQCATVIIEKYGEHVESKTLVVDELKLPDTWSLKIPGMHNRYNAALALAAARALDVPDDTSRKALEAFAGVPGRLELVREVSGVKIYNDTTATTPEATLAALRALDTGTKNIVIIMGGADKDLDMNTLLYEIPNYTKRVILLAGTGTNRVLEFLPEASVFDDLAKAVSEAFSSAVPGDIILFSPAFASFGMFKNEYDRGDQFVKLVQGLSK
ncbi:MAG: UDP-N-acetylmuramoyl-L-alanine--D-glutamate ligase [Candidatus Paceibacterota bacterium]|jgi:UDP-N-acetylmuramoylalanine--D-glutamate ligase